jgi:hypothetical protein
VASAKADSKNTNDFGKFSEKFNDIASQLQGQACWQLSEINDEESGESFSYRPRAFS